AHFARAAARGAATARCAARFSPGLSATEWEEIFADAWAEPAPLTLRTATPPSIPAPGATPRGGEGLGSTSPAGRCAQTDPAARAIPGPCPPERRCRPPDRKADR